MWTLFSCFPQQRTMNSTPPTADDLMLPGTTTAWCSIGNASLVSVCCFTNLGQFAPCPRLLSLFDLLLTWFFPCFFSVLLTLRIFPFHEDSSISARRGNFVAILCVLGCSRVFDFVFAFTLLFPYFFS